MTRKEYHFSGFDRNGTEWCIGGRDKPIFDLEEARRFARRRLDEPNSRFVRIIIYILTEHVVEVVE